jgi:hypothetical protein
MATGIYNRVRTDILTKKIDFSSDTIKVALMTNSHVFDATHLTWEDVSANEIPESGNIGYTSGGNTITGMSVSGIVPGTAKWNGADVQWSTATFTAYHAVAYDTSSADSGSAGTLLFSIDFNEPKDVLAENFIIRWDNTNNAIVTLT